MNEKTIDSGIDNNDDGHCDLCGKFVDEEGHHKACLIFTNDESQIESLKDFLNKYYEFNTFNYIGLNLATPILKYFYTYTLNDINDPYSSPWLNRF